MIARRIPAADSLQATFRLNGFGGGSLSERRGIYIIKDVGTLRLQLFNVGFYALRHLSRTRDDEALVAGTGFGDEHTILIGDTHQQALGDVVAVEAGAVDSEDGLDKFRRQAAHRMDGELHEQFPWVLLPHIAYRQQDEEVIVGFSPLQERLAAFHILHEVGGIAPNRVRGRHINRGVEFPARPRIIFRRVARTVEEHVVDAGTEHQVEVGL